MMLFLLAALIPFAFAQYQPYFSPIVPKNAQSYHPYAIQPMYGQLRRSPVHPPQVPQMPMFQPSQSQDGYYGQQFAQADGVGSDFAAYQQNAAMLQRQQVNAVPRSPYPPSMMSQQRGLPYEMPTQVIYGKPEESQPPHFQPQQTSSASSLSLPKFLEGAESQIVEQYKTIIRKPNSKYEDQVKELDQLVSSLDDQRQALYRQFMQENDQIEDSHRQKVHDYVGQMSSIAQEQFAKISALLRNPSLANEERWARVLALYGKMDSKLKDEFETRFKDFS